MSDTALDRLFTLTPGGDLGAWLGDSRWTKPEGMAYDAGALGVQIADGSGIFSVDAHQITTSPAGSSTAANTGAIAVGGAAFGGSTYLCDPSADQVVRLSGSTLVPFATGIKGGEGLAFGPGAAWGTDLYVADANLTSLGTTADGPGRVARVAPDGSVTTLALDATLLKGASALAFDNTGRFHGDLFVADILADRILEVTPAGAVSVFASGFKNLSGSHGLAFGPDGALYVADPGSGESFSNSNGTNPPSVYRIARNDATVGVPAPVAGGVDLAPPAPNPARNAVTLRFTLPARAEIRLTIVDATGRTVRVVAAGELGAGGHALSWDGRDHSGHVQATGLYFARLTAAGETRVRRIAWLR